MWKNRTFIFAHYSFTLTELVVSVGIVIILIAMVFVGLDPIRKLGEARNARRYGDTKAILEAAKEQQIRSGGMQIAGISPNLRMIGKAASGCSVVCGGGTEQKIFATQITSSNNDAEEKQLSNGTKWMYLDSGDLELTYEDLVIPQWVGMRFTSIPIPQRATITNAYIQFTVDEATSVPTSIVFYGEATSNPPEFNMQKGNISFRPRVSSTVAWSNIPAWTAAGAIKETPALTSIIQQIVNQDGWASGNALVIMVYGTGNRIAKSFNGLASAAPRLVVEYVQAQTTENACLDLSSRLAGLNLLPVDPSKGTQDKTYYAIQSVTPEGLRVVSCVPERGMNIELAR
ncbi:MAG: hypothetical protein V1908_00150 [Candidatus Peregrinibacteria bacterium]